MKALFHLWAHRKSASSPFHYCSDRLDSLLSPVLQNLNHKSNLDSISLPQVIGPVCSSGAVQQCLSMHLHFISTEISNNVCRLAVCSSGVVSNGGWHDFPQKSTRWRQLVLVLLQSQRSFYLFICLIIHPIFHSVIVVFSCMIWWNTMKICKCKQE